MTTVNTYGAGQTTSNTSTTTNVEPGKEFNNFIKLLTAQVRNQDPLSPMDSTQFVEQLATFSSLEQLVNSNAALGNIASMISNLNGLMASEWIGQDVSFASSWVPYMGETQQFTHTPPEGTTRTVLTVKNSDGETVWSETLDNDKASFSWNGQLSNGGKAPQDVMYEIVLNNYDGSTLLETSTPHVLSRVTDVISEGGVLRVGTSAGLTIDLAKVSKR